MDVQRTIYVTYLEKEGPYIKVWGQTDRNLPIAIEKTLQQVTPQFEQGLYMPALTDFHAGLMCCAKFKDGNYYRAKVTSTSYVEQGMIEILFLDYGNKDIIPCSNIRTPIDSIQLLSIPPQAKDFILAEVAMPIWDIYTFEAIASELRYLELEIVPICEIRPHVLIRLLLQNQDVTTNLINRGLVVQIPIQSQQQTLQQHLQSIGRTQPQVAQPPPPTMGSIKMPSPPLPASASTPTLLFYKAMSLENGSEHDIYVSYVSDGPCLFSVQLQKLEGLLKRLMTEINSIDLQPLDEYPLPGTVCLAQSSEDDYICRAVITSMVDGQYKVFYVDFGNTEVLEFGKLFQIPLKYVIPKVMATRFALSGLESANVSIEMKCAFKDFVNNKLLRMQVKPAAAKSALPLCDLWDENGVKAIDIIRQSALMSYPEPVPLPRGFSQDVKVSYVCSCNKFYVQLKSKEDELASMMSVLSEVSESRPLLDEENLKQGSPCYALYTDGVWYRGQIVDFMQGIKVKYVDYGNEEYVPIENLREPVSEHIFQLRPQAIECCLNGYQNIEPDTQRDTLLEELIIEQEFNMKVVEMQTNRALVELFDSAHYNVASLLLDKIASATSQVSPLLIQDNHRIEHRKRSPPQNYRDKRPLRELNERNNETNNWRQNSFSRNRSKPSIEIYKRNNGGYNNYNNNNRKNRNQQRDSQDSSDSKESFHSQRSNSFSQRSGGYERNAYQRGPKKFDGPRQRIERSQENGNITGGEWNRSGGNTENRGFVKRERRYDDKRYDNFQQSRSIDRGQRQPRGPNLHGENEDRPKRFNRNSDFSRDDGHPKKFHRFEDKGFGDGYRNKRNDFKRDSSEKSFSDTSEKSWKKNSGSQQSLGKGKGTGYKKSPVSTEVITAIDDFSKEDETWSVEAQPTVPTSPTLEENLIFAAPTDQFKVLENLLNQTDIICISWFYNPQYFYIQLEKYKKEFRDMMEEIQNRYKRRQTTMPTIGQPVIALFPEDKVLYRAQVLSCNLNLFQVRYIDYGNTATVDKIYEIETKYMELPAQAICCSLDGITPCNENWLDADSYSSYFDKDTFSCTFISTFDTNMYYVDLVNDGNSVSEKLIVASLALQPHSDFDINMLVGQQLMVFLREVEALDNIKVEIEPNLKVDAMMHNLANATETFEDELKSWIGNFLIIYVDNVVDNKLEVTFYSTTGQKLKVFVPDEGAYDYVEPLCPLPIYTKTLQGFVCHATPTTIFLQPLKQEQTINHLINELFNHYQQPSELKEKVVPQIDGLYAVHSSDTNWYRGKITKMSEENEEIEIYYIDYGNTENVKVTDLQYLPAEYFQTHMLGVEIQIEGGDCEKFNNFEVCVEVQYGDEGWLGKILNSTDETPQELNENHVEMVEDQVETTENEQSQIIETQQESILSPTVNNEQIENASQGVNVNLSHSDSPSEFYLQLSDDLEIIEALQTELQLQIPNLNNLENPAPGSLCAAPFSLDGQWYRAQILDADDDITTVRFIDYGNTDVIDNKTTSIKTLPTEMLTTEYHARLCSLYIKPVGSEWSTSAIEKYEQFLEEKSLRAEILHQDEKTTYVELYANNEKVAEYLKMANLATELQLETDTSSTGFISHLNSPSEFWMQLESSVPDLEWVAEQLTNASNFPVLQDLTPGSLCAAIFPEDESWYRARILSNTVAGIEVIFIDYGNSFSCTELRELPEDLVMLSPLALKCSLQKPTGILQWSVKATEKFNEISADGATVFNVNILTTGETSIVQLTVDSEDVSYQLLPETRDCLITYIDALDDFWVQFIEDESKLNEVQNNIANADSFPNVENPEINDIVAATYEDVWYRAKVLNKTDEGFNVLFIDYGNKAVITTNLKQINDCDKIHALAKNYKLEVVPRTKWAEDATDKFHEMNADGKVFQLEEASESVARLYFNGGDIRTTLGIVKYSPINSAQSSPKKMPSKEIENDVLSSQENVQVVTKNKEDKTQLIQDAIKTDEENAIHNNEPKESQIEELKSIDNFERLGLNDQTISDTSQPDLDEISSHDTSKESNSSLKFVEGIAETICDNAVEISSNEKVPKDKLDSGVEAQCSEDNSSTTQDDIKAVEKTKIIVEPLTVDKIKEGVTTEVETPKKLSDNEVHSSEQAKTNPEDDPEALTPF